jgi:hypothetical protein
VRYFATASGPKVREAMRRGLIGHITTPASNNTVERGVDWAADNGCFGAGYPGDDSYLSWLAGLADQRVRRCAFAVAPDVVGDAAATLERSTPMLSRIRTLGYPVAFVAQNGLEDLAVPWDSFDAFFLGGDTAWKLGPYCRALAAEARHRGKWVHMGRCNSAKRLRYAHAIGCHSADGTYLAFGPDENLPKLLAWLRQVNDQYGLWETVATEHIGRSG